jgi:hypothetical protein
MNAYELADDLENSNGLQYITKVGLVSLSAKMLRQQAQAIATLSDRIERKQELIREQTALLVKQNNRIAELEDRLSMYEIKDLDRGLNENRK